MFLSTTSIVIMAIGTVLSVLFLVVLGLSGKYNDYIAPLDEKEFPLHDLYGFGFMMLDIFHYNFNSKKNIERKKESELWYGGQYAVFYVKAIAAQKITLSTIIFLFGFILFGFTNEIVVIVIMGIMAFAIYMYFGDVVKSRLNKRAEILLSEFPDVVAELALLINAGMIMKEAWRKIAENGNGEIHKFMKQAVIEIDNGTSEIDAYNNFGINCIIPEIRKFTSTMVQGLTKGNSEFSEMLKQQNNEIWIQRQNRVRQTGEKAASKLLIPILVMFIGILVMIIVPIFANI